MNDHYTYSVKFVSGVVKIGVTAKPYQRVNAYVRQASRHGDAIEKFCVSAPMGKGNALALESAAKREFCDWAVPGHAETFFLSGSFFKVTLSVCRTIVNKSRAACAWNHCATNGETSRAAFSAAFLTLKTNAMVIAV